MIYFLNQWILCRKYLEKLVFMDSTEGNICTGFVFFISSTCVKGVLAFNSIFKIAHFVVIFNPRCSVNVD